MYLAAEEALYTPHGPGIPIHVDAHRKGRAGPVKEQLRLVSWIVIAAGLILLLASLFADPLGIGQPGTSFGWKQIAGTIAGALLTAAGVIWTRRIDARPDA